MTSRLYLSFYLTLGSRKSPVISHSLSQVIIKRIRRPRKSARKHADPAGNRNRIFALVCSRSASSHSIWTSNLKLTSERISVGGGVWWGMS